MNIYISKVMVRVRVRIATSTILKMSLIVNDPT